MGLLAESKRSSKISRDPNNTKWTKNTDSFGQKIMRSQGWEPGQYLGAQDAAQAETYTAANASYIRVSMKDDMKGLGFNKAKEDQVTGLDVFSDLLSRLNGRSEEEVEDGRQARMAVKANMYVEQRWGPMRFVSGGLLVGDKLKGLDDEDSVEDEQEEKDKKSRKRKASENDDDDTPETTTESTKKKRRKEDRKAKKTSTEVSESSDASEDEKKAKKKSKKSKKSKSDDTSMEDAPSTLSAEAAAKAEKKERKREKKEKKEAKRRRKEGQGSGSEVTTSVLPSAAGSGTSTPVGTGTSTPQGSRNFVRSRFIAQKKQALLDTKALNQIFMVKA